MSRGIVQPDAGLSSESDHGPPADRVSFFRGWKEGYQVGYNMAIAVIKDHGLPPQALPSAEPCDEPLSTRGRAHNLAVGEPVLKASWRPDGRVANSVLVAAAPSAQKRAQHGSTVKAEQHRGASSSGSRAVGYQGMPATISSEWTATNGAPLPKKKRAGRTALPWESQCRRHR